MKTYISVAFISVLISSCTNSPGKRDDKGEKNSRVERNTSINRSNSYSDLFTDSIAVAQFINKQHLDENIAAAFEDFYNARNYQFAWFNSSGLTEQTLAFRSLYDYNDSVNSKKILDRSLDNLMSEDSAVTVRATDPATLKTELLLTWRFINYLTEKYKDSETRLMALQQLIPVKKEATLTLADAMLAEKNTDKIITNSFYPAMLSQLKLYTDKARKGGWSPLPATSKKLKKGVTDPFIIIIKKRLQQSGDFAAGDTSAIYTPELETTIKKIQAQQGLETDGIINASFIKTLNISPLARVQQLLINLERMRWMPASPSGRLVLVNIPEFIMHVRQGTDSVFNMDIVVGKEGHSTVMFSGSLNQVVFSPYWNLPASIVQKEVLPSIKKNEHYLEQHNMEVTGEEDGVPVIRQLPGDKNELGKVKFLFPNSFNIYFHDTPHKELFTRANRAFSHGCIRLREPEKMAEFLLQDQPEWTTEKIEKAMNSGKEQYVKIKTEVPVLIYYYTAWADEQGTLQWREDIYGHDKEIAARLFTDPQAMPSK